MFGALVRRVVGGAENAETGDCLSAQSCRRSSRRGCSWWLVHCAQGLVCSGEAQAGPVVRDSPRSSGAESVGRPQRPAEIDRERRVYCPRPPGARRRGGGGVKSPARTSGEAQEPRRPLSDLSLSLLACTRRRARRLCGPAGFAPRLFVGPWGGCEHSVL